MCNRVCCLFLFSSFIAVQSAAVGASLLKVMMLVTLLAALAQEVVPPKVEHKESQDVSGWAMDFDGKMQEEHSPESPKRTCIRRVCGHL